MPLLKVIELPCNVSINNMVKGKKMDQTKTLFKAITTEKTVARMQSEPKSADGKGIKSWGELLKKC